MTTVQDPTDTFCRLIAASKVNSTGVHNAAGDKLGSVYDVMLNEVSGQTEYAVLSFGGFLDGGEMYHPLSRNTLKYDTGLGGYVVGFSREKLEGAPGCGADEMARWDDAWDRRISDYYSRHKSSTVGSLVGTNRPHWMFVLRSPPMPEPSRFTPTPSTQLRDCQESHIRLTCRPCGRVVALLLVQIGRTLNEPQMPLWQAPRRFRCRQCGRPPAQIDPVSGLDGAHTARSLKVVPLPVG